MLLRSSSTPVLGSLLPSFVESPNNIPNHHHEAKPITALLHHIPNNNNNKLSFHQSPIDLDRYSRPVGFRRAQSDGNLAGQLIDASKDRFPCDSSTHLPPPDNNMFARRPKCLMLETIPSFSMRDGEVEGGSDTEDYEERDVIEGRVKNTSVARDVGVEDGVQKAGFGLENELVAQSLCLETGVGFGGGDGRRGGGGEFNSFGGGGDGEDNQGIEEYYRRMVEENPGNSLYLGNYARFLYQSKRDLEGAEEFYSRAILADPNDGRVLSQYAKIVWELSRDQDRATSYFERAVQASPQDSHVQAEYAHFLWEMEDDETEDDETGRAGEDLRALPDNIHQGFMASATA